MIKLGSVFSGIGAIEQALKRLNFKYVVKFACDNGGVEIDFDQNKELKEIRKKKSINEKKEYIDFLYKIKTSKNNFVKVSYLANYQIEINLFFNDIKLVDGKDFEDNIDLFVGGSPCQSFSVIGKKRGLNDSRGTLFYDFARLIKEIRPKVFIYENV